MQVTTQKAVSLDCTEIKDILTAHLRKEGILPEQSDYKAVASIGAEMQKDGSFMLTAAESLRIKIVWVPVA